MGKGLIWLRLFGVVDFRFVKTVRLDLDVGLRLSYRSDSYGEDAVPVRLTKIPGMTSARQLEPVVTTKVLIQTGRNLHHDSGRTRTNQTFSVVQELYLAAFTVRHTR